MTAVAVLGIRNAVGFGMGTGLSFAYVDKEGNINTQILGEAGNVIIDTNPNAPRHTYTEVCGVLQRYLSQHGVKRLAYEYGLVDYRIDEKEKREKYIWNKKLVERLENLINSENIDEEIKEEYEDKMKKFKNNQEIEFEAKDVGILLNINDKVAEAIFKEMGYYLAVAIFEMHRIFNIENVVIFGGVTAGLSGGIMKEEAERIIKEKFPQLSHIKIHLTPEPSYGGAIGV